ncbi:hypothetical protein JW935_07365 [candidate division KSB1 bacterium]|nr:hypothetical protein [candidate division KSB1 bacterium]
MQINKKWYYCFFPVLFFLFFNVCCDKDNSTEPEKSTLVGSWIRVQDGTTIRLVIMEDGQFEAEFDDDSNIDIWGTYAASNNQITFYDEGGATCDTQGMYRYSLSGKKLTFTLVEDECDGRRSIVLGIWSKI